MTAARRLLLVGLSANILFFLAPLTSCGGGNGSGSSTSTAQSSTPAFSSTPATAASQGTAYTYQVTASDPAGSAITYALTSAPTGATISGNTVNWTPTGAQSRVSNSFTVTATTSGGSATQSWTVTPTGTITINSFNTNWTSSGPVQFPGGFPMGAAVIPNADGSFTVLPGSASSPGVFTIPNVPAGYFWLTTGINLSGFSNSIWTSSGTIDLGQDIPGPSTALTTAQNTTFDFDLSGLDATTPASLVEIATDSSLAPIFYLNPSPAATTVSWSSTANSPVDWSKIDTAFLMQYEPLSLGSLNTLVLGPELTLSSPGFTNGGTNAVTETLSATPQTSINLSIPGSQWMPLFNNVGPTAAVAAGSWLSISAEPFVVGRNQSPDPFFPNLPLVTPNPVPGLGSITLGQNFCLNGTAALGIFSILPLEPAMVSDQDFGVLAFGDPFPSTWTRALAFCQTVELLMPVAGSAQAYAPFNLGYGVAVAPSSSPSLAPLAEPVQNPMINGTNLFTQTTVTTTAVTLSWSAPQGAKPYGYRISALIQTPLTNGVQYGPGGEFGTAQTSASLPPLTAGKTYVFVITTEVDGSANMETSPYHSSLPTAFAQIVSAPITISADATTPSVHGDAKMLETLSQSHSKTSPTAFPNASPPIQH
jgi:fibronectin type III domain protein